MGSLLLIMMILSVLAHGILGLPRFGYVNRFDEAIGVTVRKHCGVAAEGVIVLSRWTQNGPVFTDEMAHIRRTKNT